MPDKLSIRLEVQNNPVDNDVPALFAVVRPILVGLLYALKKDIVAEAKSYDKIKLKMLPRYYRRGDGDFGICFEYAVHDALQRQDSLVVERVADAIKLCKVPGTSINSILFGAEKQGASQLIATAKETLTDESVVLAGVRSRPPKLKNYLNVLAAAFRRPTTRLSLPTSINGLWKADLFLGTTDGDKWVGTSVKSNPTQLESANGLRVGIIPETQGRSDRIRKDERKNLIICPLPYDGAFMEIFNYGWNIVQQLIEADAKLPKDVALPAPSHRYVARELVARREFTVLDIVDALGAVAQPELLSTSEQKKSTAPTGEGRRLIEGVLSPLPKKVKRKK